MSVNLDNYKIILIEKISEEDRKDISKIINCADEDCKNPIKYWVEWENGIGVYLCKEHSKKIKKGEENWYKKKISIN